MQVKHRSAIILEKAKVDIIFRKKLIALGNTCDAMVYPDPRLLTEKAPEFIELASDAGLLDTMMTQYDLNELLDWLRERASELAYYAQERPGFPPGKSYLEPVGKVFLSWTVKLPREREAIKGIRLALDFFNVEYFDYTSDRMDDSQDHRDFIRQQLITNISKSNVSVELRSAEIGSEWIDYERREIEKNPDIRRIFVCLDWTYAHLMQLGEEQESRTLRIDLSGGHSTSGLVGAFNQIAASASNAAYYQSREFYERCFDLGLRIRSILESESVTGKPSWLEKIRRNFSLSTARAFFLDNALKVLTIEKPSPMVILDMAMQAKSLLKNAQYREAIEILEKAIEGSTASVDRKMAAKLFDDLSFCYSHLGEHDRAIEEVDRALSLIPRSRQFLTNKGLRLLRAKRIGEAEACAIQAMKVAPEDPAGRKLLDMVQAAKPPD